MVWLFLILAVLGWLCILEDEGWWGLFRWLILYPIIFCAILVWIDKLPP